MNNIGLNIQNFIKQAFFFSQNNVNAHQVMILAQKQLLE